MSAIAGIHNTDGRPADPHLLDLMLDRLASRGPHGHHRWVEGSIGLGHRLLRATPESSKEQCPLSDARGECRVVWDGRVDNRADLLAELTGDGGDLGTVADAEILLHAYRKWGVMCFQRILGDFALAIWDGRTRTLVCARDPIGVKPLYYHWDGRRLLFASEIRALLAVPDIAKRPYEPIIADYLLMSFRDPEATFFEGIKQLRPGHLLRVKDGALVCERYWDIDPAREFRYRREQDYLDHFQILFRQAVHCRLRAPGQAGVLLSGGIDSTGVAAMAASLRNASPDVPPIEAFSLLHPGFPQEEWDAIQALINVYGVPVRTIRQDGPDNQMSLLELFLTPSETLHYDALLTVPLLLKPASATGITVLLTGFGADELFHSCETGFLEDLLRAGRLRRLRTELRLIESAYGYNGRRVFLALLWAQLPVRVRRVVKMAWGRQVPDWIAPAFAERVCLNEWTSPATPRRFPTLCQEKSFLAVFGPSTAQSLNWMDAACSAYSLECRHPFLDRRLIEFFLAIPPDVKLAGGYRKMFFQRAMQGVSAGPLRPSEGTDACVPAMAVELQRRRDALRLRQDLFHPDARVFRYVNRVAAETIRERYLAGEERHFNRLWHFANLEQWLREFFPSLH